MSKKCKCISCEKEKNIYEFYPGRARCKACMARRNKYYMQVGFYTELVDKKIKKGRS